MGRLSSINYEPSPFRLWLGGAHNYRTASADIIYYIDIGLPCGIARCGVASIERENIPRIVWVISEALTNRKSCNLEY